MKKLIAQTCLVALCVTIQTVTALPGHALSASAGSSSTTTTLNGQVSSSLPYVVDNATHLITVNAQGDVTTKVNKALNQLVTRSDKSTHWTLKFEGGRYYVNKPLFADNLTNVSLVSDRKDPAVILKAKNFSGEYLFYSRYASHVSIEGFQFYGLTSFANDANPVWGEQGVYFGSGHYLTLQNNRFHNFGNAALRITTSESDPNTGVNSSNVVVQNNYFANVYQVTTTSNDFIHGGTSDYLFYNNNFINLKGSVKFATRVPAHNVRVLNNNIIGSARDGFEISSYSDIEVSGNRIENIVGFGMNCYTNDRVPKGFNWGDNFIVKNNTIKTAGRGIRFSPNKYDDGFQPVPTNVQFASNIMENIGTAAPAFSFVNGSVNKLSITRSKLNKILSNRYFMIPANSTNVTVALNTVEGASYNNY